MSEEWRDIVGYEGLYQVSSKGRVKNTRNGEARLIFLLGAIITLSACSSITVKFDPTCDWFEDQQLTKASKEWIRDHKHGQPFPDFLKKDLNEIADNTQLSIRNCPHIFERED